MVFKKRKVAVLTGATGLIGGEIALRLAQGGWDVVALVRCEGNISPTNRLRERLLQSRFVKRVDLTKIRAVSGDTSQVDLGLTSEEQLRPDIVIHCAADTSFLQAFSLRHPNVVAIENILRFVKDRNRVSKIVLVSTAAVNLGYQSSVISEDDPRMGHQNGYTYSKVISEQRLKESGLNGCVVRPSIVISQGINNRKMARSILWVLHMLSELGAFPIDPESRLDMVPVEFVADAVVSLIEQCEFNNTCYHISAGLTSAVTCHELIESVQEILPSLKRARFIWKDCWPDYFLSDPKKRRIIAAVDHYLPFINANAVYSDHRIRAVLGNALPPCPKPTEYVSDVMFQVGLCEAYEECSIP